MARARGFSLVEAVVAIAVVSILAGMMMPLGLKVIDQRREIETRRLLQQAFEAMFGAPDRRVANLRADFGFEPTANLPALPVLLRPHGTWGGIPPLRPVAGIHYAWGHNGPYWTGPLDGQGAPADAWGHPLDLRVAQPRPGYRTWQVHSSGAGPGRDLVYPPVAASTSSYEAGILLVIQRRGERRIGGRFVLHYGGSPTLREPRVLLYPVENAPVQTWVPARIPAGCAELRYVPPTLEDCPHYLLPDSPGRTEILDAWGAMVRSAPAPFYLCLDLLPGTVREVRVEL